MSAKKTPVVPIGMEPARRRLERWRKTRTSGVPMPESLWAVAVKLARRHGIYPTARTLGLEYNKLKRLVQSAGGPAPSGASAPGFVELIAPRPADVAGCRIELEGPHGGRVKIELAAPVSASLVVELCRAAWGNAR
jgi:hypothetical protein